MKAQKATLLALIGSITLPFSLMSFKSSEINKDFYKAKQKTVLQETRMGATDKPALTSTVVVWAQVAGEYAAAAVEAASPEAVTLLLLDHENSSVNYKSLNSEQISEKNQEVKMSQLDAN